MAVVELGMNHPGEIAQLARIAQPTWRLVNNASASTWSSWARWRPWPRKRRGDWRTARPMAWPCSRPTMRLHAAVWQALAALAGAAVTFGGSAPTSGCTQVQWMDGAWQVTLHARGPCTALHIAGRHNVQRPGRRRLRPGGGVPLAAIGRGLGPFGPVKGRSRHASCAAGRHRTLVDDSYNANPTPVRAAIDVLAALPAPRLLVLGDMGEVGDQGRSSMPRWRLGAAWASSRFTLGSWRARRAGLCAGRGI